MNWDCVKLGVSLFTVPSRFTGLSPENSGVLLSMFQSLYRVSASHVRYSTNVIPYNQVLALAHISL